MKERNGDMYGIHFVEELWQDLHYGWRVLLKSKGFTLVAVLTLALGIGANTAIFSVIDAVILRSLPFKNPEQLVQIANPSYLFDLDAGITDPMTAPREDISAFAQAASGEIGRVNLTDTDSPERVQVLRVSSSFFPLLGVGPVLGRIFTADEQKAGENRVAILSHRLWNVRFDTDPNVLSKLVRLNGQSFTIIGVMPREFEFHVGQERADIWVPMVPKDKLLSTEGWWTTIGRLKPTVSLPQARAGMELVFERLVQRKPKMKEHKNTQLVTLTPLGEAWIGNLRSPLLILLGAVACVLLIACANVANLLLARATTRRKEVAIRAVLGASRWRLMRQWLTESWLLALVGGALGLLFAAWGVKTIVAVSPVHLPMMDTIGIDGRALIFTLVVSLLTGSLFGLAPAWPFSRPNANEFLKEGGQRSTGGFSPRLRNALTVIEIALALVLLITASLLVKNFVHLLDVPLGFDPRNVLTLELSPPEWKYPGTAQRATFYQQIVERVRALPGVQYAGTINRLPLVSGDLMMLVNFAENQLPPERARTFSYRVASTDYFRALGIQLLAGRYFNEHDNAHVIIEQSLADWLSKYVFPNESLIGKHLILRTETYEIIGVVADVQHQAIDAHIYPGFYLSTPQRPPSYASLVIRTAGNPMALAAAVRQAIQEVDPDHPIYNLQMMEQHVTNSISRQRFAMLMFSVFSWLALLLSVVGIYGIMSYTVSQRTHEIGIRMALGAQPRDVRRMILREGMLLTLLGVLIGAGMAFALRRVMVGMLYNMSATDPAVFTVTSLLLICIALVACYVPARRATKVDPMIALRYQ